MKNYELCSDITELRSNITGLLNALTEYDGSIRKKILSTLIESIYTYERATHLLIDNYTGGTNESED